VSPASFAGKTVLKKKPKFHETDLTKASAALA